MVGPVWIERRDINALRRAVHQRGEKTVGKMNPVGEQLIRRHVGQRQVDAAVHRRVRAKLRLDQSVVVAQQEEDGCVVEIAVNLADPELPAAGHLKNFALRLEDVRAPGSPVVRVAAGADLFAEFGAGGAGVRRGAAVDRRVENHRAVRPSVKPRGVGVALRQFGTVDRGGVRVRQAEIPMAEIKILARRQSEIEREQRTRREDQHGEKPMARTTPGQAGAESVRVRTRRRLLGV